MRPIKLARPSKDKEKIRKWAKSVDRKVLWKDERGFWYAATDRRNTPRWAVETEDL